MCVLDFEYLGYSQAGIIMHDEINLIITIMYYDIIEFISHPELPTNYIQIPSTYTFYGSNVQI